MTDAYRQWATTRNSESPYLSVVIPTHNEEWRILPTIGAISAFVSGLGKPWELIVSDDGSTDQTVALVRERGLANLRVLETPKNTGKGGAVRRGVLQARGELVLFADADQATPIEQLPKLIDALDQGSAIAIGSRSAAGASVQNKSFRRRVLSAGLNAFTKTIFRLPVEDTQCGFKLFRGNVARQIFGVQQIDGFSFDLEVLYIARRSGLEVAEVPVEWFDAPGSTVDSSRDSLRFLKDMPSILKNGLGGSYVLPPGADLEPESAGPSAPSRKPAATTRSVAASKRRRQPKIGANK